MSNNIINYEENYNELRDEFFENISNLVNNSLNNYLNQIQIRDIESYISFNFNNSMYDDRLFYSIYNLMNEYEGEDELNSIFENSIESSIGKKSDIPYNLNSIKYDELENKEQYENFCSICTENYKNLDEISLLECNHLYHKDCIKEWSMYKNTCPICRKNFEDKKE